MPEAGATGVVVLVVAVLAAVLAAVALGAALSAARARRARDATLLRERRDAAAQALVDERARIARELHDILSHSVSVMVLQAAGAKQVLATEPDRAEAALAQVVSVGRQSMGELRRLLGVLREDGPAEDDDDLLGPQPGMADLPALVTAFRTAGLDVRTEVLGRAQPLDPSVDLSAHRIVREALTNVSKHVGPQARVLVRQAWSPGELRIEVSDSGAGPLPPRPGPLSTGHGLVGLRERARAVGGRLDAGPLDGGGFRVAAVLPVTSPAEAP